MLYLIGLGINKENITLGALEATKECDELYLEGYTSVGLSRNELEKIFSKKIKEADRNFVESFDVNKARNKNIGILVYGDIFSATTHVSLMLDCKKNNIDIKGVFDKTQSGSKYSQYWRLKDFGMDVKLDKNKYFLHHKVFIIDNETVITGSFNPSSAGEYKNDENIVIIHNKETAKKYLEEFSYVWNQ